jgi:cyanobactin maturation PatA/PatG family protease
MLLTSESSPSSATSVIAAIPGFEELWAETLGDPRICIAVLDGPVDLNHSSLASAELALVETLMSGRDTRGRLAEHGTHVLSIIFGGHNSPVRGIAPECRGLIAPIFADVVEGNPVPCSQIDLARALLQVVQAGANIINISGGEFSPSGAAHPLLADAVRACARQGALIVAAAGNQGCDCLHIPGALPSVLAVGAMDAHGKPLPFSNWGGIYKSQGILAPGENILGAKPGGGIATASGTSFATAIVSGVAALMLSLQLKRGQKPDTASVRNALLQSALGCTTEPVLECQRLLAGRLDVRGAVSTLSLGERNMTELATRIDSPAGLKTENSLSAAQILPASIDLGPTGAQPPAAERVQTVARTESDPSIPSFVPGTAATAHAGIAPADCGCGCGGGKTSAPQLVYALGQLGFDFGTEARRDTFIQSMDKPAAGLTPNPFDPNQLLNHLESNPWAAASLTWTLSLDGTTIYAVKPEGPFAGAAYERLRQFLKEQTTEGADRVSVPGVISGKVRLMNGQVVPVITPELRGMYNWTTAALIDAVAGATPSGSAPDTEHQTHKEKVAGVLGFLERVYYELRNLGITPQERAMNYAGTNAFQIERVYDAAMKEEENTDLESIEVERSPVCRPDSDCWDVKLHFFFPDRQVQTVRKVYRFAVDVSDVIPVTVGPVRSWYVR